MNSATVRAVPAARSRPALRKRPNQHHHGDLARALREAALLLAVEQGTEGVTLRELARRVGVTHAAAYRHFADRTALLVALAVEGYRLLARDLAAAAEAGEGALERLRLMGLAYVRFALRERGHFAVMFSLGRPLSGEHPELDAAVRETIAVLGGAAKEGLARGELQGPSARDIGVALWTCAHGFATLVATRQLAARSPQAAEQYFAPLLAQLLQGFAAGPR